MARKKKDYTDVAKQLIDIVGKDNVVSLTHCETRLRFVVKNRKKIDDKAIQNLPDVKGVFYGDPKLHLYQVELDKRFYSHKQYLP